MAHNDERAEVEVTGKIDGLHAAMSGAQKSVEAATEGIAGSFEALAGIMEAVMAPVVAFLALFEGVEWIVDAANETAEFAKEVHLLGLKTGLTAEEITALRFAADQSEVSVETLSVGLKRLAKAMDESRQTGSPQQAVFHALGVAATDAEGHLRPMREVMLDVADRFAMMEDGAGKTSIAMELFGRSGADLLPMLNEGRLGIQELEDRARDLGVTMGQDAVDAAERYERQVKELRAVMADLKREISIALMPVLTTVATWFKDSIGTVAQFADEIWRVVTGFSFIKQMARDAQLKGMLERAGRPTEPAKTPAPDIPDRSQVASQLDQWNEELNVVKEHAMKNKGDLVLIEIQFWEQKLALAEKGTKDYITIHSKIVSLEEARDRADEAWARKQQEDMDRLQRSWQRTLEGVPNMFAAAIRNMKGTAGSFRDFMREMWYQIVAASASALASMVAGHYAAELAKRGITKTSAAERVLIETGAAIKTVSIKVWEGIKWIAVEAAKAAAAAWSAMSGIPVIGPALGVAAAIATFAGVLALAKTFSAFNGFDVPANMNPMTQLHAEEMVLPKEYANVIRNMSDGGGGGGGPTNIWHISAIDAASFESFAMKHGGTIYKAAFSGGRAGKHIPGTPGRGPG